MTLGELSKFQDYFRKYYFYRDTAHVSQSSKVTVNIFTFT